MRLSDIYRDERAVFPARITARTLSSGRYRYSWTEQTDYPTTGYADADPARGGTSTTATAFEVNNAQVNVGAVVWMRMRSGVDNSLCYEFTAPGTSSAAGPTVFRTETQWTTTQTAWAPTAGYTNYNVSTNSTSVFLQGVNPASSPVDGQQLLVRNDGAVAFRIDHLAAGAAAGDRIVLPGGLNYWLDPGAALSLVYDAAADSGNGAWVAASPGVTSLPLSVRQDATLAVSTTKTLSYTGAHDYSGAAVTGIPASVSNSDGTLTVSPTTGAVVASLNLAHVNAWTRQQYFAQATLTDAASISWDLDQGQAAKVTLGGNRTLANPSNKKAGGTYTLIVVQDGTGSRTLAYGTDYKWPGGTAPTLTTTASAVDILTFISDGTGMFGIIQKAFS